MKKMQKQMKITDLLALAVFTVFAVCVLMVLLTGAGVYRNLTEQGQQTFDRRTAAHYVITRFRQGNAVSVEEFGDCQSLTFREEIDGEKYLTRIYCYEGFLRELFTADRGDFSPEDGEKILQLEKLSFSWVGSILSVQMVHTDGSVQQLLLHTSREVVP